ncbi:XRE family transcriptional regulator [Providencia rettgeri]|uniref:XRE family transcriptional regulator n=1 Tax=Providencia rettgeri TaxID=587 RepID=UPI0034E0A676
MAIIRKLIQDSSFDEFYPTTMIFSAAKRTYFLGHSKDTSYIVYSMTDTGKIEANAPVQKGRLRSYLSNIQAFYDVTQNKQYLYGYNLNDKIVELYQIDDKAGIQLVYVDDFAVGDTIQSATLYVANGLIHIYSQSEKDKRWRIHNYTIV